MPLYPYGADNIRKNLESIRDGRRIRVVAIGRLTDAQLVAINTAREASGLQPIVAEIVFAGGHVYKGRILRDGYSIEDVIDQITSAIDHTAIATVHRGMTSIQNQNGRADRYGNQVRDQAVFECTARYPRAELFSVIPKGDSIKPQQKK